MGGLQLRGRSLDSLAHVGRQSVVAGAAQLAGSFLRFGTVVLVARLVGPAALGLYVLALTLANGATVVATLGLDRAVLRFIAHHRGRQEPGAAAGLFAFSSLLVGAASVAMSALIFLGASRLSSFLHHPELAPAARVIALALPFLTLGQMARAGLTGFQDIRLAVALEQLVMPALTALLLVALHRQRPADSLSPVVAAAVAQGAVGVLAWMVLRSRLDHEAVVAGWPIRDWLGFSFPLWLERGLLFVVVGAGYGFLARSGDTGSVAAYGAAWRVAAFVGLPLAAVASIFGPTISNLVARDDWMTLQSLYARLTWALAGIGGVLGLTVALAGRWVLAGFGPRFSTAAGVLATLVASQVVNVATGPSGLVLIMAGRTGWRLTNAAAGAGLTVSLSWLAVPRWGALGAAVALALSTSLINVVQVHQVRRLLGLWAYAKGSP